MNGSSDLRVKYYWPFKKSFFPLFSGMFLMLEDATWARLAMAMSALKGFEEDNNMLKKSTLSLSTISFQTKPVPQVCESCCRNQRRQSDCRWFWRRPPHRYLDLFLIPWFHPFLGGPPDNVSGRVTEAVTAILEAGRRSLDNDGATVKILYDSKDWQQITDLKVVS